MSSLDAFKQNVTESVICFAVYRHIPPRAGARSNANRHPVLRPLFASCSWMKRLPNVSTSLSVIAGFLLGFIAVKALYGTFQSVPWCVATRACCCNNLCTVPCNVSVLTGNDTFVPGGNIAPAKSDVTMLINPRLLIVLLHDNHPPNRC